MDGNMERALNMLDNTFSDYLMHKTNEDAVEKRLSTILSSLDLNGKDKRFEVNVVRNNMKEPFFGMRVFPVIADMDVVTNALVTEHQSFNELCNLWREIKNWYIEIDSGCFDRLSNNFIPKELTSLIIHEIAHTVYSDKPLEVFYRAYQEAYMRMKISEKASIKFLYLLYMIPLSGSCMLRNWINGKNEINQEIYADAYIREYGYTEYLESAIGKIIKNYGTAVDDATDDKRDDKICQSVNWCNLNIADLTRRKTKLKDDLYYRTARSNSHFMKALSMKILTDLGLKMRENYSGAVVEATIDIISEEDSVIKYSSYFDLAVFGKYERAVSNALESTLKVAMESHNRVTKLPSQYDIDAISIEIDRIENQHDRIYVLDLIYNKIGEITEFLELINGDKAQEHRYLATGNNMLTQLQKLREAVLAKKSFNKDYKVFVKYPSGYEG